MSDLLLEALSTRGSMSIPDFYAAFDTLLLDWRRADEDYGDLKVARNQSIRYLDSLGHCEFDFDSRKVYVCAPCIARLPVAGLPKAVLIGARTQSLIRAVNKFKRGHKGKMGLSVRTQEYGLSVAGSDYTSRLLLPKSIIIDALSVELLEQLASDLNICYSLEAPVAWGLASFSAGLTDIKGALSFDDFEDPGWAKQLFYPGRLTFGDPPSESLPTRALLHYTNPITKQPYHIVKEGEQEAAVDRDWGRYLMLDDSQSCVLFYNERRQQLAVPHTVPLPKILARAATLCSGRVPSTASVTAAVADARPRRLQLDVYSAVPCQLARIIAEKLSQPLHFFNEERPRVSC